MLKPPLSPPAEATPLDLVAETPVQLGSKLKPDEPVTPAINPDEWKKATEGNWDIATRGKTEQIKHLIAEGMEVNALDKEGMTALYRAAHNDQKETVLLLLGKGANVSIRDKWGGRWRSKQTIEDKPSVSFFVFLRLNAFWKLFCLPSST